MTIRAHSPILASEYHFGHKTTLFVRKRFCVGHKTDTKSRMSAFNRQSFTFKLHYNALHVSGFLHRPAGYKPGVKHDLRLFRDAAHARLAALAPPTYGGRPKVRRFLDSTGLGKTLCFQFLAFI